MGGRLKGSPRVGGRQKGTPNKTTSTIAEIARRYTDEGINVYLEVMTARVDVFEFEDAADGKQIKKKVGMDWKYSATERMRAAELMHDRGWGRVTQDIKLGGLDGGALVIEHVHSWLEMKTLPPDELVKQFRSEVQLKVIDHEPSKKVA